MVDRNGDVPEDQRIVFRIGVNLGDVIIDGGDIYGDGVNIAARLEGWRSRRHLHLQSRARPDPRQAPYPFEDMGEQSVKNIARPVRAYAMGCGCCGIDPPRSAAQAQPEPARHSIIPRRAVITASLLAAIGFAIVAWWVSPQGNSPVVSVQAPAVASPQIPPAIASTPAPRLSIVVLPLQLSNDRDNGILPDESPTI